MSCQTPMSHSWHRFWRPTHLIIFLFTVTRGQEALLHLSWVLKGGSSLVYTVIRNPSQNSSSRDAAVERPDCPVRLSYICICLMQLLEITGKNSRTSHSPQRCSLNPQLPLFQLILSTTSNLI